MTPPTSDEPQRIVVITTFDEPTKTDRCVRNLLATGEGFDVLVVDHGHDNWRSPSDSRVEVIKASPDLWWAGACNEGIGRALDQGAQSIMLVNPDCILDGRDAESLFAHSAETQCIVAPVQLDMESGKVLCAGVVPFLFLGFPTLYTRKRPGGFLDRFAIINGGRGVVIPSGVFFDVGTLAAGDLPHYAADHDFFLRCRRHGYRMLTIVEVAIQVDQSRTSTATRTADLSRSQVRESLSAQRSHRNLASVQAFFKRNYPIKPLHFIGTALYVVRYLASWAVQRAGRLLLRRSAP